MLSVQREMFCLFYLLFLIFKDCNIASQTLPHNTSTIIFWHAIKEVYKIQITNSAWEDGATC